MSKDNNNLTILSGQSVLLPSQNEIQKRIYSIRGVQVMLDRDLAQLYQVETKVLNQAVKRNMKRFPDYYMFRLTEEEWNNWKSQFVTSNYMSEDEIQAIKMGVRRPPFAFTEQGVSQLSSVLKSDRAIETSIRIIDVFVAMRKFIFSNAIANYNTQYPLEPTRLHTFERSHDRWLIIDDIVYHFGASLKDLGKRWFSVDIVTEHTADDFISRL